MLKTKNKFKLAANIVCAIGLAGSLVATLVAAGTGIDACYKKRDMFEDNARYTQFISDKEAEFTQAYNEGTMNEEEFSNHMATLKDENGYVLYLNEGATEQEIEQFNALQNQIANSVIVGVSSTTVSAGMVAVQAGLILNKERRELKEINRQNAENQEKE